MTTNRKTVKELREFLSQFDDSAEIGVILGGYGGSVTDMYLMEIFQMKDWMTFLQFHIPHLCVDRPEILESSKHP